MKNHQLVFSIFFIFFIVSTKAQNKSKSKQIDSLSNLEYKTLRTHIKSRDSILSSNSLDAYLTKAKKYNDTLKITRAYLLLTNRTNDISYTDSIIDMLDGNNIKFKKRLSIAYFGKGMYYYDRYLFNESLKNYLKANELLPGSDIDMKIGLIRIRIGEYEEALKIFQKIKIDNLKNSNNNNNSSWLYFAIAETHRHLKNWDSTNLYINFGHNKVIQEKNYERKAYFTLMQGANYFGLQKYHQSIDSLMSVSKVFINNGDQANLMFNYYFLGISNYKIDRKTIALKYFKKIDSLYQIINHIEPEFRKSYEILINESSKKNDLNNQLKYVNSLIKIDSTFNEDYRFLTKNLYQKYDTPMLLSEKQHLINQINKENSKALNWLKTSILFVFILCLIVFYFFKQNLKNKKKFLHLLETNAKKTNTAVKIIKDKQLNINPEVVNVILNKIEKFENKKDFYKTNITLNNLSKQFDTNSKYLSQIIKHYKDKKFTDYINSLRIENAIEELKNNNEYKKYTLKAIASEFGFNSTESFSSAFYKNTGLKPSYFLKELWQKK